jgi:MSHA pilin protein MshA
LIHFYKRERDMKRQGGFTLIELVVVIVILGILAVTAAPRFLNLQGDARAAALSGLSGAMIGGAGIVYGKSAIEGEDTAVKADSPDVDGVTTHWGYPTATQTGIVAAVQGLDDATQWVYAVNNTGDNQRGNLVATFPLGDNVTVDRASIIATQCYVTYTEANGSAAANEYIVAVTDTRGC